MIVCWLKSSIDDFTLVISSSDSVVASSVFSVLITVVLAAKAEVVRPNFLFLVGTPMTIAGSGSAFEGIFCNIKGLCRADALVGVVVMGAGLLLSRYLS